MKKMSTILIILVAVMFLSPTPAHAIRPEAQTPWNSMTDFFATFGKSEDAKRRIKADRRENRRQARVFKQDLKKKKLTQKKIEQQNQSIMDKIHVRRQPHGRGDQY